MVVIRLLTVRTRWRRNADACSAHSPGLYGFILANTTSATVTSEGEMKMRRKISLSYSIILLPFPRPAAPGTALGGRKEKKIKEKGRPPSILPCYHRSPFTSLFPGKLPANPAQAGSMYRQAKKTRDVPCGVTACVSPYFDRGLLALPANRGRDCATGGENHLLLSLLSFRFPYGPVTKVKRMEEKAIFTCPGFASALPSRI